MQTLNMGTLSDLAYEIRERIWLNLVPTGQDTSAKRCTSKTNLSILRASHDLHSEIVNTIYKRSRLELEVSPLHAVDKKWMVVEYSHSHYLTGEIDSKARWVLKSPEEARKRGFSDLPFGRIDEVVVRICAPDPDDLSELFVLRGKVGRVVEFLGRARVFRKLRIRLCKRDGQDWNGEGSEGSSMPGLAEDHEVAVLPFCTLRNVEEIVAQGDSKVFEEESVNWEGINWGLDIVRNRSWARCDNPPGEKEKENAMSGHDVDRKVAEHLFFLHYGIWMFAPSPAANHLRRELLAKYFDQGISGHSPFEDEMLRIASTYPALIKRHDPDIALFKMMHCLLVCGHRRAQDLGLTRRRSRPRYWDQGVWGKMFPGGIPAATSLAYKEEISPLEDWEGVYLREEFYGGMGRFIREWMEAYPWDESEGTVHVERW